MKENEYLYKAIKDCKLDAFERFFHNQFSGVKLLIRYKIGSEDIEFVIHDFNLKILAIAEFGSFDIEFKDLTYYKKEELSELKIRESDVKKVWLNFLNSNYPEFKQDYLDYSLKKAEEDLIIE